eukprot:387091_1
MSDQLTTSELLVSGYNREVLAKFNNEFQNYINDKIIAFLHKPATMNYLYLSDTELKCIKNMTSGISRRDFCSKMKKECYSTNGHSIKIWNHAQEKFNGNFNLIMYNIYLIS